MLFELKQRKRKFIKNLENIWVYTLACNEGFYSKLIQNKLRIRKGCFILNLASFVISRSTILEFMFCIVNLSENSFSWYATLVLFIIV